MWGEGLSVLLACSAAALAAGLHQIRPAHVRLREGLSPRERSRRSASGGRIAAREFLDSLAAQLEAGAPPRNALLSASDGGAVALVPRARAAALMGSDVSAALRRDADAEGVSLLAWAAACWEVGEATGAGLAASLRSLAESARDAERSAEELRAALAGPRATARILALLPVLGLVLGQMLGGSTVRWLMATGWGWLCLSGAVVLSGLGYLWAARIARKAQQPWA